MGASPSPGFLKKASGSDKTSACRSTSSTCSTGMIFSSRRIFIGISRTSLTLSLGIKMVLVPPRCAASAFSLSPPMGSTRPRKVISPVIAMSLRTGTLVSALTIAVAMVTPADGPSLGTAPSATCTCTSTCSRNFLSSPNRSARLRT